MSMTKVFELLFYLFIFSNNHKYVTNLCKIYIYNDKCLGNSLICIIIIVVVIETGHFKIEDKMDIDIESHNPNSTMYNTDEQNFIQYHQFLLQKQKDFMSKLSEHQKQLQLSLNHHQSSSLQMQE